MSDETAAARFTRDYSSIPANEDSTGVNRKTRGLDAQTDERQSREYVNLADGTSATGRAYDATKDANHDGMTDLATGATAGTPGSFTPSGYRKPASVAAANAAGIVANPATAWTTGQRVVLYNGTSLMHWTSTTWATGAA